MVELRKHDEPLDGQFALAELIHAIRNLTAVEDFGDIRLREVVALAQFLQLFRPDAGILTSLFLIFSQIDIAPYRRTPPPPCTFVLFVLIVCTSIL